VYQGQIADSSRKKATAGKNDRIILPAIPLPEPQVRQVSLFMDAQMVTMKESS
jgi:hypothetical protein